MQKIGLDNRRPAGERDAHGVLQAKAQLGTASATLDSAMSKRPWAAGEKLTMADCAAMPALHYANRVLPLEAHGHLVAYLRRLEARPSFARVLVEAAPFFAIFPG